MRKIYTIILLTFLGISSAWALNAKIEQSEFEGNRKWYGEHVVFEIHGEGSTTTTFGGDGRKLQLPGNVEFYIDWIVDPGYIINVTKIQTKIGSPSMTVSFDIYFNNIKCGSVGGWGRKDNIYLDNLSLGNDDIITVKLTETGNIYYLDVTYDITPITYYMAFHGNGNTGGEMANQAIQYDASTALTANAFEKKYTFTYNANEGECDEESKEVAYDFAGWSNAAEGEVVYTNGQTVKNLTAENGKVFDLYAVWTPNSITLPTPTREGFVFDGWYDAEEHYVGKAGDAVVPTKNLDLIAKWADILTPMFVLDKTEIEIDEVATLTLDNVSEPAITIAPEGIVNYNAEEGTLTGLAKGEVTITIEQSETGTIAYKKEVLKLTVNKITPSLTVVLAGVEQKAITLNPGQEVEAKVETSSDAEVVIARMEGECAAYAAGSLEALDGEGTAVFRAKLDETERYQSDSVDFTVTVVRLDEETCYVLEKQTDEQKGNVGETVHEHTWDAENAAGKVIFEVSHVTGSVGVSVTVQEYVNGSWNNAANGKLDDFGTSFTVRNVDLSLAAKGVRFVCAGTLNDCVRNVRVTRKTYLNAQAEDISAQWNTAGETTLKIDYSIANGGDLKIVCDNELFSLANSRIANVDCLSGSVSIPVTFAAQENAGEYTANIVIYNGVYRKELQIKATVAEKGSVDPENPEDLTTFGEETLYMCEGDVLVYNNTQYEEAFEGNVLLDEVNVYGGDSIVYLIILVGTPDNVELFDTLKVGDVLLLEEDEWYLIEENGEGVEIPSLMPAETNFTATQTLVIQRETVNSYGCDSVIVRHVAVEEEGATSICPQAGRVEQGATVVKELRNGVLYIRREGMEYTVEGLRVK